ncbi:hypothetical protein ANN_17179 [Periplaneta americana]|uniref:Uncharacterized protein n=1 Tax=Periplaneta americana TaxID=6978 RepID=A0ABQ8STI8_PERAM|nr:hypothetical protein ANN_17179 [Periplaneta americana]
MSPGSCTESYPAFAHTGLRENPGKNLNQVTCPNRESNPGHLGSQPEALTACIPPVLELELSELIGRGLLAMLRPDVSSTTAADIISGEALINPNNTIARASNGGVTICFDVCSRSMRVRIGRSTMCHHYQKYDSEDKDKGVQGLISPPDVNNHNQKCDTLPEMREGVEEEDTMCYTAMKRMNVEKERHTVLHHQQNYDRIYLVAPVRSLVIIMCGRDGCYAMTPKSHFCKIVGWSVVAYLRPSGTHDLVSSLKGLSVRNYTLPSSVLDLFADTLAFKSGGRVAQLVEQMDTDWKVRGSIPGDDRIFSGCQTFRTARRFTQPPIKLSTGSFPGVKGGQSVVLTTPPHSSAEVMESMELYLQPPSAFMT